MTSKSTGGSRGRGTSKKKAASKKKVTRKKATKKDAGKKTTRKKTAKKRSSKSAAAEPTAGPRGIPKKNHKTGRLMFPDVSPVAWEHPADRAAMAALRKVAGFDAAVRALFGTISDRSLRLIYLGSAVRVNRRQFRHIHELYLDACRTLDVGEPPELFISQTPLVNAGAIGVNKPFIVLNSGALELLTEEEVQFIIGHELGHVMSGHALYKTMLHVLLKLVFLATSVPLGSAALLTIVAALLEWDRRAELSADRAGLLVVQDLELVMQVQMKMAGGGETDQMDVGEFISQAEEYEAGGSVLDSVLKLLNLMGQTHPFSVLRLAELKRWVDDGEYDRLLEEGYPIRSDDGERSMYDDIVSGAESYKKEAERSKDPLFKFLRDIAKTATWAGSGVFSIFSSKPKADDEEE